jgi:hypothetical protein
MATLTPPELQVSEWTSRDAMFMLHGVMLLVAFILAFPVGIIAIKSSSSGAFKYHWMVQVSGFILTTTGVIIGLVLSPNIRSSRHKQLGISIGFLLSLQLVSGWRHHVIFSKIRRRTWISKTHIWLGRLIIGAGWCNLVIGLSLGGFADKYIYLMVIIVCIEAIALVVLHYRYHEVTSGSQKEKRIEQGLREAENQFALLEGNSDDDEEL